MANMDPSVLKGAHMFESLDERGLAAAVRAGIVRHVAQGATIFAQGDAGATCHTLLDGRVKIAQTRPDGAQSVIRYIGPGEMYGTVAALMDMPFPADAVAVLESCEIYWTVAAMRQLMAEFPAIALQATASAGARLMELQNRVGELSTERVEQRIARAVMRLAEQAGRVTPDGIEIDFPISRQELAELAGSTLHTVSRTLSGWDERQITASSRRHIVVKKPKVLLSLAEATAA